MKLPAELATLFIKYLIGGSQKLCSVRNQKQIFVFMDRSGKPMGQSQSLSHYWSYLLGRMGAKFRFPPHR